jgi:hypothetical protein
MPEEGSRMPGGAGNGSVASGRPRVSGQLPVVSGPRNRTSSLLATHHHPLAAIHWPLLALFPSDQVTCIAACCFRCVRVPSGAAIFMRDEVKTMARHRVIRGFPVVFEATKLAKARAFIFFAPRRLRASRRVHEVAKKPGQPAQDSLLAQHRGFFGYPGGRLRNRTYAQPVQACAEGDGRHPRPQAPVPGIPALCDQVTHVVQESNHRLGEAVLHHFPLDRGKRRLGGRVKHAASGSYPSTRLTRKS